MDLNIQILQAIELSIHYHNNQFDKSGRPYVLHPLWVMSNVNGIKEKIVAVLHDIIEDTECDEDELRHYNIDEDIIEAVMILTKPKQEEYMEYIKNISRNAIATKVKLIDLKHNMDLSRLPEVTDKDLCRVKKYKKAYEYLINIC